MDINFLDAVRDDYEDMLIAANAASVKRAEFGFVDTDCYFIKSMLSAVCLHALDNPDIFINQQSKNIMEIINILNHGN